MSGPKPKHTIGTGTKRATTRQFTDREKFLQVFEQTRQNLKDDQLAVLVFYGVGGIGKTALRKELMRRLEQEGRLDWVWTGLDFDTPEFRLPEATLSALRQRLEQRWKVSFPTFDVAYAVYWRLVHPQVTLTEKTFPLLDTSSTVIEIVTSLGGDIPVIGLVPKLAGLAIKGSKTLKQWW